MSTDSRTAPPASREALDVALARLDPESADHARAALEWLTPDEEGLGALCQQDLQDFLWYHLPLKWMLEPREHHEVAWSLGDLFAELGLDRYARLCRDPATHRLLDSWDSDPDRAHAEMVAAGTASGVEPLDTPLLRWGTVMGLTEALVRHLVSVALERAVADGSLVPGARGWRQQAARIQHAVLTTPSPGTDGLPPLDAVRAERLDRFAHGTSPEWRAVLDPVRSLIDADPEVGADAAASLVPLRWLLQRIGDGVMLTQTGNLPRVLVREANDHFGWFDLAGFSVRSENDVRQLADLHQLARRMRLLTKRGRRMSLSAAGRRAVEDPVALFRGAATAIFTGRRIETEAAVLTAALLLAEPGPVSQEHLRTTVGAVLGGRWRTEEGLPIGENSVHWAMRDIVILGGTLGWVRGEDEAWGLPQGDLSLTPAGRLAALAGLHEAGTQPRSRH